MASCGIDEQPKGRCTSPAKVPCFAERKSARFVDQLASEKIHPRLADCLISSKTESSESLYASVLVQAVLLGKVRDAAFDQFRYARAHARRRQSRLCGHFEKCFRPGLLGFNYAECTRRHDATGAGRGIHKNIQKDHHHRPTSMV
jgi:hypothetical protein